MAAEWDVEMQEMFDRLQRALSEKVRAQLRVSEARVAEHIDTRLEASEGRLTERLSHRFQVQAEELQEIVRTAADNYGGVLDGIHRELADLRQGWQTKAADTERGLTAHAGRIVALERITGVVRG